MNQSLPAPVEGGRRAQTPVVYRGERAGGFTITGQATGRDYRFAQSPTGRSQWVFSQDLERFRLLVDFDVLDEFAIDPEGDELRALIQTVEVLRSSVTNTPPTSSASPQRGPVGRPPISEEAGAWAWHLHHHCGWGWREVAAHEGLNGGSPEAAVQARGSRWAKRNPAETDSSRYRLCMSGDCPPTSE